MLSLLPVPLASNVEIIVPAIVFTTVLTVSITGILAGHWRKTRQAESEAALKAMMLKRGMSAAEIERVMNAGRGPGGKAG